MAADTQSVICFISAVSCFFAHSGQAVSSPECALFLSSLTKALPFESATISPVYHRLRAFWCSGLCMAAIVRCRNRPHQRRSCRSQRAGRLLKDRALCLCGTERNRLFLEAANAYTRASEINKATYPLINAATLSMLAGRHEQAQALAHQVLSLTQSDAGKLERPITARPHRRKLCCCWGISLGLKRP